MPIINLSLHIKMLFLVSVYCLAFCCHSPELWSLPQDKKLKIIIVNDDFELIWIGRSDILTVMLVKFQVFWDVILCHWLKSAWCIKRLFPSSSGSSSPRKIQISLRMWHCMLWHPNNMVPLINLGNSDTTRWSWLYACLPKCYIFGHKKWKNL